MLKPLFAKGKSLEVTLAAALSAGANTISLASAEGYAPGDAIFVAESDGSGLEFCGLVTSLTETTLDLSLPLTEAKSASATAWAADSCFQWPLMPEAPAEENWRQGILWQRDMAGRVHSVRFADPEREERLRFDGMARSHCTALQNWLQQEARGGLDPFTRVDRFRRPATVQLLTPDFEIRETSPEVLNLSLDLAVLEEGAYL